MYRYIFKMALICWVMANSFSYAQGAGIGCEWDRTCTATDGSCIKFFEGSDHVYTIKAFAGCCTDADITAGDPDCPMAGYARTPTLNGNWPRTLPTGERVFEYVEGYAGNGKPSAVSYNAFGLTALPTSSEPPGAQLNLTDLHSSCGAPELHGNILFKLNPNVTRQKDDLIRLVYPSSYIGAVSCNTKWLIWSSNCDGNDPLWGPKNGSITGTSASYTCGSASVELTFNECNGLITSVSCNGTEIDASTEQPYLTIVTDTGEEITPATDVGPYPGVVACVAGDDGTTGAAVLSGDRLWLCVE